MSSLFVKLLKELRLGKQKNYMKISTFIILALLLALLVACDAIISMHRNGFPVTLSASTIDDGKIYEVVAKQYQEGDYFLTLIRELDGSVRLYKLDKLMTNGFYKSSVVIGIRKDTQISLSPLTPRPLMAR